ncbi:MAG: hypothetical protein M0Z94_02350, partial [Dehalococcoidales bacterium]|nr:hypothetical protein [Dehalococcoidales bacterium]
MRKVFLILVLILTLITVLVLPAAAAETVPASVTVNEFINFTVTDHGGDNSLSFGNVNPGSKSPEVSQTAAAGAVTLSVGAETNVNCNLQVAGTNFTSPSGDSILISNALWALSQTATGTALTMEYQTIGTSSANTATTLDVWHWLTVPAKKPAGTYTS